MKKWLTIFLVIFPSIATADVNVPFSLNNYTPAPLTLSVEPKSCGISMDPGFNGATIPPFSAYSYGKIYETECIGQQMGFSVDLLMEDNQGNSTKIGTIKFVGNNGGTVCSGYSLSGFSNSTYWSLNSNCTTSIGYKIPVTVSNSYPAPLQVISQTPAGNSNYQPAPSGVSAMSGNTPGTSSFTLLSANDLNDAQNLAIVEYGPSSNNYCKFTYGYPEAKCYADQVAVNNGNEYVACDVTSTVDNYNFCQLTFSVMVGTMPVILSEPPAINVNVDNKVYTNLTRGTFNPTDTASYIGGGLPPSTISDGNSLKPAFQFNQAAASNKQPTVAYTVQQPGGPTCSFNYGWDDVNKVCYANATGSADNVICSAMALLRTTSADCDVALSILYANPPTVSVTLNNDATASSDQFNLKDYQPTSSSDYAGSPPPSSIAPSGNGTFTYNVQNTLGTQPYVEYNYTKTPNAYCKFRYDAVGTGGCIAYAEPINSDPVYQVTCNRTYTTTNGMCTVNFSMNVGPIKPPTQFNVTINNGIYDDLENSDGDDNAAPNSIQNGESSATYQESAGTGNSMEKTVTYQMKNFPSSTCTFTYGWSSTESCYASGVSSVGPPIVDCGKATSTRNGDSCDVNLTFGMPGN